MIKSLKIANYAIIEELEIKFSNGLTIITGETGAGKSILLGALGLIMGKRADSKALYDQDRKCVIEAHFELPDKDLEAFFELHDLDFETEVLVRREITPSGKSRSFVNDTPVNLKILQELSNALVDLHQQFDTLDIHDPNFQLKMIDALAENKSLLSAYRRQYRQYQADRKQLKALIEKSELSTKEMDFLNFQLEELAKAELTEGEQAQLEEELQVLTNAEDIKRVTSGAFQYLTEAEQSIVGQLEELGLSLSSISDFDKQLKQLYEKYNGLVLELQDVAQEFERIAERTEFDQERIQEVQQRLDQIYRLQNKHQVSEIRELLEIQQGLMEKVQGFGDMSKNIETLKQQIETQDSHLREIADTLRKRRIGVVDDFEKKVQGVLKELSMKHARLQVDFQAVSELGPNGMDEVTFLFAANKGSRLQTIKEVASGGELSRLALVTKSLVASAIPLPTMVFDEIDSGISGDVALKMGNILRRLSNEHQVVTITHSPQVASKADVHYFIFKKEKETRTVTKVKLLSKEDRVKSIAVMLSQNPPSASALENARELIELSQRQR